MLQEGNHQGSDFLSTTTPSPRRNLEEEVRLASRKKTNSLKQMRKEACSLTQYTIVVSMLFSIIPINPNIMPLSNRYDIVMLVRFRGGLGFQNLGFRVSGIGMSFQIERTTSQPPYLEVRGTC